MVHDLADVETVKVDDMAVQNRESLAAPLSRTYLAEANTLRIGSLG